MKAIATTLCSILFTVSAYADFDIEKKEIQIAVKEILQKDGLATKEDAEKFWKRIPNNAEAEKAMNYLVNEYLQPTNQVQYEMWFCAKKAWIEKKTNNCTKAKRLIVEIEKKIGKENFDSTNNLRKLKLLIQTSAKNESYFKVEGVEYDLSLNVINKTIARIDEATDNLKFVIKNKQ